MFSFARITQLWLAAAPVKAPDELAALALDPAPGTRARTCPQKRLDKADAIIEGLRLFRVFSTHPAVGNENPAETAHATSIQHRALTTS